MTRLLAAALVGTLPRRHRETILGDLAEEGVQPGSADQLFALAPIALRLHVEPWRDARACLGTLATGVLAYGLLRAVGAAGWPDPAAALDLYRDPFSRAAVALWSATHLTGAVAVGLFVGYASWIPAHAGSLRWQLSLALAATAALADHTGPSVLPPVLLLFATWLADRARGDAAERALR